MPAFSANRHTPLCNTHLRYGWVQMAFHWSMAAGIGFMLVFGLAMAGTPWGGTVLGMSLFEAYQLHKSIGLVIGVLALARLAWRFTQPSPRPAPGTSRWVIRAASANHGALYALMIAMPMVGWITVSASPLQVPTSIFGLVTLPHLTMPDEALESAMMRLHGALALLLALLIGLHIVAVVKHHAIDHDPILRRILPWTALPDRPTAHAQREASR